MPLNTRSFKNPVPPLLLMAAVVVIAFVLRSRSLGTLDQTAPMFGWVGYALACSGMVMMAVAAWTFRQHRTTLNPIHIDGVSALVKQGVFRYSRNPMYLGMVCLTAGLSLAWISGWGLLLSVALLWYLDRFQIRPEEKVLGQQFGQAFVEYTQQTRRWFGCVNKNK